MISSTTLARSLAGRLIQISGMLTLAMLRPPGDRHSLKRLHQVRNGDSREHGRFRAGLGRQIGAGHRYETGLAGRNLDLAMANMARQVLQPVEAKGSTEQGMRRVGDRDAISAGLITKRGAALAAGSPSRSGRRRRRSVCGG
jgi:hypothetical protein